MSKVLTGTGLAWVKSESAESSDGGVATTTGYLAMALHEQSYLQVLPGQFPGELHDQILKVSQNQHASLLNSMNC